MNSNYMKIRLISIALLMALFCVGAHSQTRDKVRGYGPGNLNPEKVWVFILAGQSNMAGRGKVEAQDTISSPRVLSINENGEIIPAKEPLHFYEPRMKGVGCGLAFGKELLNTVPEDVTILLIPTAVGGSSINQWISNATHRNVTLLSNFREKVEIGKRYGTIKAILWHQGESDAKPDGIQKRQEKLKTLFTEFRNTVGNPSLPILMGELGSYSKTPELFSQMNDQIRLYAASDSFTSVIPTSDFQHIGDRLHINSAGQREMGKRFAREYARKFMQQPVVVLTFDDAVRSHYTVVAPLLKKYHFGGTFFVCDVSQKRPQDTAFYMTWPQISELNRMGLEIGNHTAHHKNVTILSREELQNELRVIEAKCKEYNIPQLVSFAYPGNRSDSLSQVRLKELGYLYGRAGGSRTYIPGKDSPLQIPGHTMTDSERQKERVMTALTGLKPGDFLVLTIHGVPDLQHPDYSTTPELFEEYLKYMQEHNFQVIAMRDLKKYIGPDKMR